MSNEELTTVGLFFVLVLGILVLVGGFGKTVITRRGDHSGKMALLSLLLFVVLAWLVLADHGLPDLYYVPGEGTHFVP